MTFDGTACRIHYVRILPILAPGRSHLRLIFLPFLDAYQMLAGLPGRTGPRHCELAPRGPFLLAIAQCQPTHTCAGGSP